MRELLLTALLAISALTTPSYALTRPRQLRELVVQPHDPLLIAQDNEKWDVTSDFEPKEPAPDDPWDLSSLANTTFHAHYHPLFEVDSFLARLASMHADRISLIELGHTAEGREMFGLRISSGDIIEDEDEDEEKKRRKGRGRKKGAKGNGGRRKRGFVVTGAQHAREWIASASALYLAHALASPASEPGSLAHLLDEWDFHIIPVPNPDGYVYTWETDRFWYKNRMSMGPDEPCQGLDMNRNWGYMWSPSDALSPSSNLTIDSTPPVPADPCSHWYPGRRPYEAPEVNNIANYITRLPAVEGFLDLRSYGQMLSWPYSYTCDLLPRDAEDLVEAALGVAHAVRKNHGTVYTTGSLCSTLYPAPGNILDWAYGEVGIPFTYSAHLRDTGTYGYALPREWIRPVGEETATMVEYLAHFVVKPRF